MSLIDLQQDTCLLDLPQEIIENILLYLHPFDLLRAMHAHHYLTLPISQLKKIKWPKDFLWALIQYNRCTEIKYLLEHFEIVKYLISINVVDITDVIEFASRDGYFEIVKYLHIFDPKKKTSMAMDLTNSVQIFEYLYSVGYRCTSTALQNAYFKGNLDILMCIDKIKNKQLKISTADIQNACRSGNIDILKWINTKINLIEHINYMIDPTILMDCACSSGNLNMVMYLKNIGVKINFITMYFLILHGKTNIVEYIYKIYNYTEKDKEELMKQIMFREKSLSLIFKTSSKSTASPQFKTNVCLKLLE